MKEIGFSAFSCCKELQTLRLNNGLEKIRANAFFSTGIRKLETPTTLKRIDNDAFAECTELQILRLREGLEKIGKKAFRNTNIVKLVTPKTLRTKKNMIKKAE